MKDRKRTVLIVDDSPFILEMLSRIVKSLGHFVIKATDGDMALEYARYREPDVIVLDVNMPKQDGLAVLGQLRKESRFAQTPIVMLTGIQDAEIVRRCIAAGASGYVLKSEPTEILARLREFLPAAGSE